MCSCIPPGGNEGCALARANVENCDFSSSIPGRGGVNAVICALESEKDFPEEESETEREREEVQQPAIFRLLAVRAASFSRALSRARYNCATPSLKGSFLSLYFSPPRVKRLCVFCYGSICRREGLQSIYLSVYEEGKSRDREKICAAFFRTRAMYKGIESEN